MTQALPQSEGSLVFRLASREDDLRVLELFHAAYARTFRPDWWEWWNYQCPNGANRMYVIEDTSRGILAGGYGLLPIRIWVQGCEVQGSLCTDVCTHPEYQGKGLFTSLGSFSLSCDAQAGAQCSLTIPNRLALPGHLRVGWIVLCHIPFLVKQTFKPKPVWSRQVTCFDSRVDALLERLRSCFTMCVLKDSHFLNWRYTKRPDVEYTLYQYEDGTEVRGYLVLKYYNDVRANLRKAHILDIQAESPEIFDDLLGAAENFADGRDLLDLWSIPGNPYEAYLLRCGFAPSGDQSVFLWRGNSGQVELPAEKGRWFCLGDNDVY